MRKDKPAAEMRRQLETCRLLMCEGHCKNLCPHGDALQLLPANSIIKSECDFKSLLSLWRLMYCFTFGLMMKIFPSGMPTLR